MIYHSVIPLWSMNYPLPCLKNPVRQGRNESGVEVDLIVTKQLTEFRLFFN